ncbi:MAG: GDP-mannose 4,6-dehydratase [Methanosarcinales archaeon]|nr:GDP-mannose 4,6-dehydratase [Methanosarcinales archaeon]
MKNRILITGGAGFIGSHLAEALVNKGYDIIILEAHRCFVWVIYPSFCIIPPIF